MQFCPARVFLARARSDLKHVPLQCADVSVFAVVRATRKRRTNLPFVRAHTYMSLEISVTQRVTCVKLFCSTGPSRRAARQRRRRSFRLALAPRRGAPRIELRFDLRVDAAQPQPPLARRARRVLSHKGAAATCFAGTSQRCPPAQAPFAVLSSLGSRSLSSLRARNKTTRNSIRQ